MVIATIQPNATSSVRSGIYIVRSSDPVRSRPYVAPTELR